MSQWTLEHTNRYKSCSDRYKRRHPNELIAVSKNLQIFIEELEQGISPLFVKKGFIHHEPNGIKAISQKGGYGRGLAETRLYIYGDTTTNILYLLCIGDKKSQKRDIKYCQDEVEKIKRRQNG